MIVEAIIKHVCETRTFTKKTGEAGEATDLVVEWEVDNGAQPYTQSAVGSVMGFINKEVVNAAVASKSKVRMSVYLEHREWNGKFFNNVRIYLPKDYMQQG